MDVAKVYHAFTSIENERKKLLVNRDKINFIDLGAGNNSGERTISEIARGSLSSIRQSRLLFNLVAYYRPVNIVELGTSLGISTMYLASVNSKTKVFTIEGNPSSAMVARNLFKKYGLNNIVPIEGNFDDKLPELLSQLKNIGLAYIDGNHTEEATLNYFNALTNKIDERSILVFDDIYWSKGMAEAWRKIKQDKRVTLTIDLYDIGIVFFDTQLSKEDMVLIQYWKKPWKLGFWG